MSFELHEPVLVIGLGGVGSKLATEAAKSFNSDCLSYIIMEMTLCPTMHYVIFVISIFSQKE